MSDSSDDEQDKWAASLRQAFSALPYFSPSCVVNASSHCAAERVLQTRQLGVSTVAVDAKVANEAHFPIERDTGEHHHWMAKHACIEAVMEEVAQHAAGKWFCVLHTWQVCKKAYKLGIQEWGSLVFCDATTTRWVVVEPALDVRPQSLVKDIQPKAAALGAQLFALLTFLGYEPRFVRCGVFWDRACASDELTRGLFAADDAAPPRQAAGAAGTPLPPLTQIDASNARPCLPVGVVDKIESLVQKDAALARSVAGYREKAGGLEALRAKVLLLTGAGSRRTRACAWCNKTAKDASLDKLLRCSKCKLPYYCSRDCQLNDWRAGHKAQCRQHQQEAAA